MEMESTDDHRSTNRIPTVVRRSSILSGIGHYYPEGFDWSNEHDGIPERRIIVSNHLPIIATLDINNNWLFEFDTDSVYFPLKHGLSADVETWYVGCLPGGVKIESKQQEQVAKTLREKFKCVPVFMTSDTYDSYYHGFCKHYLWPLFHYMLPLAYNGGQRFDRKQWHDYYRANMVFAETIMDVVITGDEFVWIHDYHLMLLPSLIRKKCRKLKIGFFLHSPFPSSEIFRTLPVREDVIRALLCSDLIGFHTFDYARHFLSTCSRLMGIDYESKRGYIALEYYGRTISIKILPIGINRSLLDSVMSSDETVNKVLELKNRFQGKIVMLGVDDMDLFKGIGLKFSAMGLLLESYESLRGKVVLVQILNPARSQGKDVQDVVRETDLIAQEINDKYGGPGYQPITIVHGPVTTVEKAAYYAIAECVVVNPVRDGMNLVPYKYTFCRQSSPVLDRAMGVDESTPKKSVIVVSEFIGCSPSLSGAIRVNPWNIEDVRNGMHSAITMKEYEKQLRHKKHYNYISSHDVSYWARSFEQDLKRACSDHYEKRWWGVGLGLSYKILALSPDFRKLALEQISNDYRGKSSRLILLDYDGTMMPQSTVDKQPSAEVISVLNCLCNDPKNVVFIVSGRGKDSLSKWFAPCKNLGLSAEHGFFTRVGSACLMVSALALFGLFRVLRNRKGINKGIALEKLSSTMQSMGRSPDFVLCIGDDRSDEDMFASISRSTGGKPSLADTATVYACTVGQKPSLATFYLDDTIEVMLLLHWLGKLSEPTKPVVEVQEQPPKMIVGRE
ncbi:hypothetical protein ACFE04_009941 [Oxalis oulophora]